MEARNKIEDVKVGDVFVGDINQAEFVVKNIDIKSDWVTTKDLKTGKLCNCGVKMFERLQITRKITTKGK